MDGLFLACLMGICGAPAGGTLSERPVTLVQPNEPLPPSVAEPMVTMPPVTQPTVTQPTETQPTARQPTVTQSTVTQPITNESGQRSTADGATADHPDNPKLSKAAIGEVVRRKAKAIKRCYELGLLQDPRLSGTVEVGWKIDLKGRVTSVNLVGTTKKNDALEDCLMAEIRHWEFAPSSEPIVVGAYPFRFDASLLARHTDSEKPAAPR